MSEGKFVPLTTVKLMVNSNLCGRSLPRWDQVERAEHSTPVRRFPCVFEA